MRNTMLVMLLLLGGFWSNLTFLSHSAHAQTIPSSSGWNAIPNSNLRSVCPPNGFGGSSYAFNSQCNGVTAAWNSGAFDTTRNRLIVWGGGHDDYYGNELYSMNLSTLAMTRLNNPSVPVATSCVESLTNPFGPNVRHTYDGLAYMQHVDRLISVSGDPACNPTRVSTDIWTYSFSNGTWQQMSPSGDNILMGFQATDTEGTAVSYDPVSQFVFIDNRLGLLTYNFATNTLKIRNNQGGNYRAFEATTVIDPIRRYLYTIGGGQMWRWDISAIMAGDTTATIPNPTAISSSGGSAIVSAPHPGLAWDSTNQRVVAWSGGNTVYALNGATNAWTGTTFSGGPAAIAQGTFKRWSYSPTSNVFVVVNSVDSPAYTLRMAAGTADTTPPTVPASIAAVSTSASQVDLSWAASSDNVGVTGYRIFRNGSQISTSTSLQYSDTGLTSSTTYVYTVTAIDGAGNTSLQSTSASATTQPQSSGGSDFASRCNAIGVLLCKGFDNTTTDIVQNSNLYPGDNGYWGGSLDTVIKVSGAGSLKFTLPAGRATSDISGSFLTPMGGVFGANSTFYVQFQQRFSPEMVSNIPSWQTGTATSWKTILFHRTGSTCGQIEITTNFYQYSSKPALQMYTGCGSSAFYTNTARTVMTGSGPLIEQGSSDTAGYNCYFDNILAGNGNGTGCFIVPTNKWITFYYKIHIGTYGSTNSSVEAWVATDGGPYTQFINVKNAVLQRDGPSVVEGQYNAITLSPYMTGLNTSASATAYTWYDDLIVSTQPIATPGGGGTPNPPPAAPTNLRIQ